MARMTKEEVTRQEMVAKQGEWNEFLALYPERFAALMYDFFTLAQETLYQDDVSFNVTRVDENTYLFRAEVSYPVEAQLRVTPHEKYQPHYQWEFETVEGVVKEYYERQAEEARKAAVKREALEKVRNTLNAEELKLLGL